MCMKLTSIPKTGNTNGRLHLGSQWIDWREMLLETMVWSTSSKSFLQFSHCIDKRLAKWQNQSCQRSLVYSGKKHVLPKTGFSWLNLMFSLSNHCFLWSNLKLCKVKPNKIHKYQGEIWKNYHFLSSYNHYPMVKSSVFIVSPPFKSQLQDNLFLRIHHGLTEHLPKQRCWVV